MLRYLSQADNRYHGHAVATVTDAGTTVTVGAPEPVLTFPNQCTLVSMMVPMGSDLLVKVQDKNGARLVRIHDGR